LIGCYFLLAMSLSFRLMDCWVGCSLLHFDRRLLSACSFCYSEWWTLLAFILFSGSSFFGVFLGHSDW
jgi:hypothetical protein